MTVKYIEKKGTNQVWVDQKIDSPDPWVHGASIIFDSRMDQFSNLGKSD